MKSEGEDGIGLATHVLRKGRNDGCMVAMEWQPEGKRKVGRQKNHMEKNGGKESREERWTSWAEVRGAAQERLVGERKLQPYAPHGVERTKLIHNSTSVHK